MQLTLIVSFNIRLGISIDMLPSYLTHMCSVDNDMDVLLHECGCVASDDLKSLFWSCNDCSAAYSSSYPDAGTLHDWNV